MVIKFDKEDVYNNLSNNCELSEKCTVEGHTEESK